MPSGYITVKSIRFYPYLARKTETKAKVEIKYCRFYKVFAMYPAIMVGND